MRVGLAPRHLLCLEPLSPTATTAGVHSFGRYRLVFLDLAVARPPTRHFFGEASQSSLDFLRESTSAQRAPANHTMLVAHYPMSAVVGAGYTPTGLLRGTGGRLSAQLEVGVAPGSDTLCVCACCRTWVARDASHNRPRRHGLLTRRRVVAHLSGHYHGLLGALLHNAWFGERLHARHSGGEFVYCIVARGQGGGLHPDGWLAMVALQERWSSRLAILCGVTATGSLRSTTTCCRSQTSPQANGRLCS